MAKKIKTRTVMFWLKSSRGSNFKNVYIIPASWNKQQRKDALDRWADQFGAMHVSENCVSYGIKEITLPPKRVVAKRLERALMLKHKLEERCARLRAMRDAKELTS